MPKLGDICHGYDIGKDKSYYSRIKKYIYLCCPECSNGRWVINRPEYKEPFLVTCHYCTFNKTRKLNRINQGPGEKSPRWKGGRRLDNNGYIRVWISESDPFYLMATHRRNGGGDVLEHRLVMARHLGRFLAPQEVVHHKNGIKDDNRIENLEVLFPTNHQLYTHMCKHCDLRKQIRFLKSEIKRLSTQVPMLL